MMAATGCELGPAVMFDNAGAPTSFFAASMVAWVMGL